MPDLAPVVVVVVAPSNDLLTAMWPRLDDEGLGHEGEALWGEVSSPDDDDGGGSDGCCVWSGCCVNPPSTRSWIATGVFREETRLRHMALERKESTQLPHMKNVRYYRVYMYYNLVRQSAAIKSLLSSVPYKNRTVHTF